MTAQSPAWVSVDDYFSRDHASATKLEYYDGRIIAQAGASARHNTLVANLIGQLYATVRQRGCTIFPSDMRVQARAHGVYTYPDISIVCGPPIYREPNQLTLLNPVTIIEILSPSTEGHDRTEKFSYYWAIDSLQEYIVMAQDRPYVQCYTRQTPHFWYINLVDDLYSSVTFASIGVDLAMDAIYTGITFDEPFAGRSED